MLLWLVLGLARLNLLPQPLPALLEQPQETFNPQTFGTLWTTLQLTNTKQFLAEAEQTVPQALVLLLKGGQTQQLLQAFMLLLFLLLFLLDTPLVCTE
jgi:hypothetical protein